MNSIAEIIIERERLGYSSEEIGLYLIQHCLDLKGASTCFGEVYVIASNCYFRSLGQIDSFFQYGKLAIFSDYSEEEYPPSWRVFNPTMVLPSSGKTWVRDVSCESQLFLWKARSTRKIDYDFSEYSLALMDIGIKNCYYPGRIDVFAQKGLQFLHPNWEQLLVQLKQGDSLRRKALVLTRCSRPVLRDFAARFYERGLRAIPYYVTTPIQDKINRLLEQVFHGKELTTEFGTFERLQKIEQEFKLDEYGQEPLAQILSQDAFVTSEVQNHLQKTLRQSPDISFREYCQLALRKAIPRILVHLRQVETIPRSILWEVDWEFFLGTFEEFFRTQQEWSK